MIMLHLKGAGGVQQFDKLDNAGATVFADMFYNFGIQVPHLGCGETN